MAVSTSDHDDIIYPSAIPFFLMHLACLGAIWTGITRQSLILGAILYAVRMFAVGAAYHRYFSHRTFKTSRWFQLFLAVLAQTSAQKSVLWWAAKHRHHHLHADTERDAHSPSTHGFLYAHLGWIFARQHQSADLSKLDDLTRFPELRWLHRYELVPAIVLGMSCFLIAGWPGVVVGFAVSTVVLFHATFFINTLAHTWGTQRYVTGEGSRNSWLLAVLTFGEGWHNNHHAFQSSVRQGFRWWEWDPTYYALRLLSSFKLIWDLKEPPLAVIRNEQRLGTNVVERVAEQLASSFAMETFATASVLNRGSDALGREIFGPSGQRDDASHALPDRHELRLRALAMFADTPSLDDIVEKARKLIIEMSRAPLQEAYTSCEMGLPAPAAL